MKQIANYEFAQQPLSSSVWGGYITGLVIGSLIVSVAITYLLYLFVKNRVYHKLLKRVGVIASQAINSDISLWARHTHHKFINSSLLRYSHDQFVEIDSLLITDKALIVIAIKSIKGGIRGSAQDNNWTKVTDNVQQTMVNIVRQNDEKINHIKSLLNMDIPIISLIVFSNKATFIDLTDLPNYVIVTKHTDIFHTLDKIEQTRPKAIEKEIKRKIVRKLKTFITNKNRDKIIHEQLVTKEVKVS